MYVAMEKHLGAESLELTNTGRGRNQAVRIRRHVGFPMLLAGCSPGPQVKEDLFKLSIDVVQCALVFLTARHTF